VGEHEVVGLQLVQVREWVSMKVVGLQLVQVRSG